MVQLKLFLFMIYVALLRTSECSSNKLTLSPRFQSILKQLPLGPLLPSDSVYVPYRGNAPNMVMSIQHYNGHPSSFEECKASAPANGAHFWGHSTSVCMLGTLAAPVCHVKDANQTQFFILESFLTDGSPDDDPFPSPDGRNRYTFGEPNVAFRVMTPTITKFPEFTTEKMFVDVTMWYGQGDLPGETFVFPKYGGIVTTDDSILVDPFCYTNSSCGVPFFSTSIDVINTPHVALDQTCGQTIDLKDNTPALHVFSHTGIGCELFPAVYPTPDCTLTITSPSSIHARVELVNFKKETCGGYELKFIVFQCDEVTTVIDVCDESAATNFSSSGGKMQVMLAGSASMDWQRYGFIVRFSKFGENIDSSQCLIGTPVPSATDFPQVSTTAPSQTFTDSPTQSPIDGSTQSPTDGSSQSPIDGSTQSPTDGSTQSPTDGSTQSPTESPTQSPTVGSTQGPTDGSTQSPTDDSSQNLTDGSTQSSTDGSTQSPTDGSTQSPTDGSTQSPTDGSTQSPTDGSTQSPTDGSTESPTAECGQSSTKPNRDTSNNYESGSHVVSHKGFAKSHHFHFLLKLGIVLEEM